MTVSPIRPLNNLRDAQFGIMANNQRNLGLITSSSGLSPEQLHNVGTDLEIGNAMLSFGAKVNEVLAENAERIQEKNHEFDRKTSSGFSTFG